MGAFSPPSGAFQPDEILVLQEAFEAVWETIKAHRPSATDNDELRAAVSTRLCLIAAEGVTDMETLRAETLRSFSF